MFKILCIPCFVISAGYVRCNLLTLKCQYDLLTYVTPYVTYSYSVCLYWTNFTDYVYGSRLLNKNGMKYFNKLD